MGARRSLIFGILAVARLWAADPFEALHQSLERQAERALALDVAARAPRVLGLEVSRQARMPAPLGEPEVAPATLLSVARVESSFNPLAVSPKGARGMWQFMPATARHFGLRVDARYDDRLDPQRSTIAAARYLHFLHGLFGDWKLALAAYNAGENRVSRAIRNGGTRDFFELSRRRLLPLETRRYVPSVLAGISPEAPGRDWQRVLIAPFRLD